MKKKRRKRKAPEARTLSPPPKGRQPNKAEMGEEVDMPKITKAQLRKAFLRPFRFERNGDTWRGATRRNFGLQSPILRCRETMAAESGKAPTFSPHIQASRAASGRMIASRAGWARALHQSASRTSDSLRMPFGPTWVCAFIVLRRNANIY